MDSHEDGKLFKDLLDPIESILERISFLFRYCWGGFSFSPSKLVTAIKSKVDASSYTASASYVVISCFVVTLVAQGTVDLKEWALSVFTNNEVATVKFVSEGAKLGEIFSIASVLAVAVLVVGGILLKFRFLSADDAEYRNLRRLYHIVFSGSVFMLSLVVTVFVLAWRWCPFSSSRLVERGFIGALWLIVMYAIGVFPLFVVIKYLGKFRWRMAIWAITISTSLLVIRKSSELGKVRPMHYVSVAACSQNGFDVSANSAKLHLLIRKENRYKDPIYLQGGTAIITGEYFDDDQSQQPRVKFEGHLLINDKAAPQLVAIDGESGSIITLNVTPDEVRGRTLHVTVMPENMKGAGIVWDKGGLDALRHIDALGHVTLRMKIVGVNQVAEERVFSLDLRN